MRSRQLVTLHVSVWVEINKGNLKADVEKSHAPRERVSWNKAIGAMDNNGGVTLHVSVWVEIQPLPNLHRLSASRSTWACELKLLCQHWWVFGQDVTLHVSVWVEIINEKKTHPRGSVTLHVSVWVEIFVKCVRLLVKSVTLHVSVWVEIVFNVNHLKTSLSRSTWACELKSLTGWWFS